MATSPPVDDAQRRRFERLALPHLDAAYNLARWLVRDDHDARDIVQDAALRAMRFIDDLRGDDARAWFLQVVRNAAFTCLRRHRAADLVAIDDDDAAVEERATSAADEPYAALARKHDGARLDRAIASLPTGYREVFVLREMEAFSYAEIARIADVPVGTVMSRLSRARARLRVALGDADRPVLRPVQAPVRSGGRG